ncbi:inosine/xanthosine triphosphatase [Salipaludibacillus keqinensis]|uniref:inosine/xanthosine triphosphatase n=1 Tax=Salipaludibacillus keqinensis TaxID=2045207 RepID=A0A323TW72_9BACI|nr:DUF84 family protein [Salipaludibacillus keqinensis]PYZ93795.1 inosine/xanthosine triphosphatase [Salipaludibacillus keqinensis]
MRPTLYVGSENPAKIASVKAVFGQEYVIKGVNAPSSVSSQPFSDRETKEGALNRANFLIHDQQAELAIGLEGGVMTIDDELFLCNWGALVSKDKHLFVASGARIPLPKSIARMVQEGKELGDAMDSWLNERDVRKGQGAVGIFTAGNVNRAEMFIHINKLLFGQYKRFLKD